MDFLNATSGETFAAILGKKHRRSQCPDAQVVVGIDTNLAVIRGARIGVAHLLPGFAFILAAIDAALIVLNERVYDVGILAIDVQPDAPGFAAIFVWQTFGEFFPGHATVGGLRIDDDPADVPGFGEAHVLPSLARIGRLIDAISPGRTLAIVGLAGA